MGWIYEKILSVYYTSKSKEDKLLIKTIIRCLETWNYLFLVKQDEEMNIQI